MKTPILPASPDSTLAAHQVVSEPRFPRGSDANDRAIMAPKPMPVATQPNKPDAKPRWSSQVPAAKAYWSKITETELQNTEGIESKLTALIEWRYALTPDKAALQVRRFLSQHCRS